MSNQSSSTNTIPNNTDELSFRINVCPSNLIHLVLSFPKLILQSNEIEFTTIKFRMTIKSVNANKNKGQVWGPFILLSFSFGSNEKRKKRKSKYGTSSTEIL